MTFVVRRLWNRGVLPADEVFCDESERGEDQPDREQRDELR